MDKLILNLIIVILFFWFGLVLEWIFSCILGGFVS